LGKNPKEVQWLLGHSDISTTLNIYSHLGTAEKKSIIDDITNALIF